VSRETRAIILSMALLAAAVLLQSTVLRAVAIRGVRPDITFVLLMFVSIRRGAMVGQLSGFAVGIAEDLVSLAPLGFHALLRSTTGFLYGLFLGNVYVDPILIPVVFAAAGTLVKAFMTVLLEAIFGVSSTGFAPFAGPLWIELAWNAVLTPFLFALLGLVKLLRPVEKKKA
jgi:rod shape-determining protein MreD